MKCSTAILIVCCIVTVSCRKSQEQNSNTSKERSPLKAPGPLALVLAPHVGEGHLDKQIRMLQAQIRSGRPAATKVEQLGWLYVAKARESFDPGYYKLAEQCAACLESGQERESVTPAFVVHRSPEAMFLRGHVLHNLHQFKQAEGVATQLVSLRGAPVDFGLLGDALMEQGQLDGAVAAYQRMADLKPDLHAFVRAAHVRWLKGDLSGALELAQTAARCISLRDSDTAAWVLTRLASYQFQSGAIVPARNSCEQALAFRHDYPPALLLSGRMLLAEGVTQRAVALLLHAAELVPLPEYQWAVAEALEANGEKAEAQRVEGELRHTGSASDPRTFALFLSTRGEDPALALRLAKEELENRQDVFTHDAVAWALAGVGRIGEARAHLDLALAEGTQDARLFFHAAVLASRADDPEQTAKWAAKASQLKLLLLPSEHAALSRLAASQFPNRSFGLAGAEK
jgi:tetratricopeptide (TPR) repeat protein